MGVGNSIAQEKEVLCTSREVVLKDLDLSSIISPFIARESVNICYLPAPVFNLKTGITSVHNPHILTSMLINCHDQIQNFPEIIEAIITGSTSPEEPIIEILNTNFSEYIRNFIYRSIILEMSSQFKMQTMILFNFSPTINLNVPIQFEKLLSVFKSSLSILRGESLDSSKEAGIEQVTNFFNNAIPPSSLTPPLDNYSSRSVPGQCVFEGQFPYKNAICSNGSFLFILCKNTLNIFPLTENGSLSPPMIRIFDKSFNGAVSMEATKDTLTIGDGTSKAVLNISYLLSLDNYSNLLNAISPIKNDFFLSDGITYLKIDSEWNIKPTINNLPQAPVKLRFSRMQTNALVGRSLPVTLSNQVFITNGNFFGMIYSLGQNAYTLRVFSLQTGEHVYDDNFNLSESIITATLDMTHKCYYIVHPLNNNRMVVRRYHFLGSDDPGMLDLFSYTSMIGFMQRKFKKFVKAIVGPISTLIGSQVFPPMFVPKKIQDFVELLDTAIGILQLPPEKIASSKEQIIAIIQSMTAIIDANLLLMKKTTMDLKDIRAKLFQLITLMPTNLGVQIFFNNLDFFFKGDINYATSIMVGLYQRIKWEPLYAYAINALENSNVLGLIPFSTQNQLADLIPSEVALVSSIPQSTIRLLIAHQRVLVTAAAKQLKKEPFADISFVSKTGNSQPRPLDNFGDYLQIIVTKFDSALSAAFIPEELQDSVIFLLFDNLIRLISPLVEFHSIARVTTALISVLLSKISDFIKQKITKLEDFPTISNLVLTLLFAYGKFAATLVKGGGLSEFESKCMWLMRANIDLIDHSDAILNLDSNVINFDIPQLNEFLNGEIPGPMKLIYKKHKAPFHKNLSEALQSLDRTVMAAICKHTGKLDQLFALTEKTPILKPDMKKAADQMIKVRNSYRSLIQKEKKEQAEQIKLRALMLLRMGSSFLPTDKKEQLISEFLTSDFSPEYVKTIIKQQRTRVQVTLVGFALIDRTYSMKIHPLLNNIIAYTLSSIESFEGLAVIMRITQLKEGQIVQMKQFFNSIIKMIESTHNNRFTLIAMRFFRDINNVKEIQQGFLKEVSKSIVYPAMFALAYSLINCLDEVPEEFLSKDATQSQQILAGEIYRRVQANNEVFDMLSNRILELDDPLDVRTTGIIIERMLNHSTISNENFYNFFKKAICKIGQCFIDYNNIASASELINIFRITINNNLHSKSELVKVLTECTVDSEENYIAGSFAVLSNFFEPLHPYCNARYHKDLSTSTEVICVPKEEKNTYIIYQKPFSLVDNRIECEINPPAFIYAVPPNQINQRIFDKHEWILSFFDAAVTQNRYSNITQAIYVQVIAHFMKDQTFMKMITQEQIDQFSVSPVPFGNITSTLNLANDFIHKNNIPQFMGFNVLRFLDSPTVTLLSPQIKPDAVFSVTISTTNDRLRGHVGIVSDTLEGFATRYSFAQLPSGTLYPACEKMRKLSPSQTYTMRIDTHNRTFSIDDNKYQFPIGTKFRVLISFHQSMKITIDCDESNFDKTAYSPIQEHACLDMDYEGKLFEEPFWIDHFDSVPSINELSEVEVDIKPVSYKERMRRNFITPCNTILIHPQFATEASREICMEVFRGLFRQITFQWMTIALVRVSAARPETIKNEKTIAKLFSILSVLLEQFYPNEFRQGRFPFSLDEPIWDKEATTNLLYLSLDIEAKNAMKELSKRPEVRAAVGKCIKAMASDPYLHLIAYPNKAHIYSPPGEAKFVEETKSAAIVTVNSFTGPIGQFFQVGGQLIETPATFYYPTTIGIRVNKDAFALSKFYVSPMDNSWIFETPFEMLILLKSYISMCTTSKESYVAKSAIIDSLVASSPFIYKYLPDFLELVQVTIPSTPFDVKTHYRNKLILLGCASKRMKDPLKERISILYSHERRVLTSAIAADLSTHFPEFFNSDIPKPQTEFCQIPFVAMDPGAIKKDFRQHILMIRLFARKYNTIVGIPFWEILPLWYRISGFYHGENDYIAPQMRILQNNFICFTNPSKVSVTINFAKKRSLPPDMILTYAKSESFEDPNYIMRSDIDRPINTNEEVLYFSLISVPNGWNAFNITFTINQRVPTEEEGRMINVNLTELHDKFISDMKEFAVEWTDEDTDTLLNNLPKNALNMPTFSTVDSITKQSSLAAKFSPTVVSLRALLIHHFNYIKLNHRNEVAEPVWNSLSKFVSCEDASDEFINAVAKGGDDECPTLRIDRHSAHRIIIDGRGNPSFSIMHQLSLELNKLPQQLLRCPKRPWRVSFAGEEAIDAGGPARELMTEAAASIFEPTSMLTFPTPNARHKVGNFLDLFVPYNSLGVSEDDFFAIGIYLGMVVRTGLVQDLPFVPFVFKFLAGGELNSSDITMIDNTLVEQFKHLREAEAAEDFARCAVPWQIEQWDGTIAMLPGHAADALVREGEVEAFINECINFRINSIRPTLLAMRKGFVQNIGIESHPLLTGSRLSHMTQGSNVITTQQLKSITVVQDFRGLEDPYIVRFFKAVDRFNPEQKKMLLRFITTLTRLPNTSINKGFVIKIDCLQRSAPDESLPTASTCFNKLHLPKYSSENICYQRLLVAIQYCMTMENK